MDGYRVIPLLPLENQRVGEEDSTKNINSNLSMQCSRPYFGLSCCKSSGDSA
jgi:hypothetical protein